MNLIRSKILDSYLSSRIVDHTQIGRNEKFILPLINEKRLSCWCLVDALPKLPIRHFSPQKLTIVSHRYESNRFYLSQTKAPRGDTRRSAWSRDWELRGGRGRQKWKSPDRDGWGIDDHSGVIAISRMSEIVAFGGLTQKTFIER